MKRKAYEYCVVVGAQHNYTDDENTAIDWFNNEAEAWLAEGKTGPRPELLTRPAGEVTGWEQIA